MPRLFRVNRLNSLFLTRLAIVRISLVVVVCAEEYNLSVNRFVFREGRMRNLYRNVLDIFVVMLITSCAAPGAATVAASSSTVTPQPTLQVLSTTQIARY